MNPLTMRGLTPLSITGAVLVSTGSPLGANLIWGAVNPLIAWHNFKIAQKEQAALFAVFTLIAWYGILNLGVTL